MAARPRSPKNRALPENLYPNGKYWQYRNPITGKKTSINRPLAEAVKLASKSSPRALAVSRLIRLPSSQGSTKKLGKINWLAYPFA